MADYRVISDTEVDPDAPVTSELAYALRDNPTAIAEGATGAPKIADLALGPAANATTQGRNWVLARNALSTVYSVGTYAILQYNGTGTVLNPGTVIAGTNVSDVGNASATKPGTWMVMQRSQVSTAEPIMISLYLRVT